MSEMIIEGKVIDQDHRETRLCLLEPTALNQENSSLLVARSLKYDQDKTPIRIIIYQMSLKLCIRLPKLRP